MSGEKFMSEEKFDKLFEGNLRYQKRGKLVQKGKGFSSQLFLWLLAIFTFLFTVGTGNLFIGAFLAFFVASSIAFFRWSLEWMG